MNGISVMACVQNEHTGFCSIYGRESRMQQKYITISRQKGERIAAGKYTGSRQVSAGPDADSRTEQRTVRTSAEGRAVPRKAKTAESADRRNTDRRNTDGRNNDRRNNDRRNRQRSSGKSSGKSAIAVRTLILVVIFAGMLAGFQMMTRASSREKEPNYKYYTTVTIGYGEDLSDIVFRYCDSSEYKTADDYVCEICEINSLPYQRGQVPDLHAGTKIVIPYFSTVLK